MSKKTVLLVYGGESSEHEVSVKSAHNVYAALDDEKYIVILCYIDRMGKWWLARSIDGGHLGQPQIIPVLGQKQFITIPGEHIIKPDVIFPILHGKNGEDGSIQGVAQMLHLPYVGPSLLGAAVTMDKDMTKRLLRDAGVPVVPWVTWHTHEPMPHYTDIAQLLGTTLFVKPSRAGSSVGVSKVRRDDQWKDALHGAAEHDDTIVIEQAIAAREIEVAVLGIDDVNISSPGEIKPGEDFYSYSDKYASSSTSSVIIPARLDDTLKQSVQQYAKTAYLATGCKGMARIDFFLDPNDVIYLNEINSIPGFTNISMYPKLMRYDGMTYSQLIERLIELALRR